MRERESGTDALHDWVDRETRHIDVVASWESLCSTYSALQFTDPLTDAERIGEFKWIVHHMNSFLSKVRTKLMGCENADAMGMVLEESLTVSQPELKERRALAYQKLRQQWVMNELTQLRMMEEEA